MWNIQQTLANILLFKTLHPNHTRHMDHTLTHTEICLTAKHPAAVSQRQRSGDNEEFCAGGPSKFKKKKRVYHFGVCLDDGPAAHTDCKLSWLPGRILTLREASAKASRCNSEYSSRIRGWLDGSRIPASTDTSRQGRSQPGRHLGPEESQCFSQIRGAGSGTENNFQRDRREATAPTSTPSTLGHRTYSKKWINSRVLSFQCR